MSTADRPHELDIAGPRTLVLGQHDIGIQVTRHARRGRGRRFPLPPAAPPAPAPGMKPAKQTMAGHIDAHVCCAYRGYRPCGRMPRDRVTTLDRNRHRPHPASICNRSANSESGSVGACSAKVTILRSSTVATRRSSQDCGSFTERHHGRPSKSAPGPVERAPT